MHKTACRIFSARCTDVGRSAAGFTLVEALVSTSLSSIVMAGVMSAFVMIGRTGVLAQNYTELEVESRDALELFCREARMANSVTAYSATSVTLGIPDLSSNRLGTGPGAYSVTYTFDAASRLLTRTGPPASNATGAIATTTLVRNIKPIGSTPFIAYFRYVTTGYQTGFQSNTATNAAEIKQIEFNFIAERKAMTVALATDKVLSARFILRNR